MPATPTGYNLLAYCYFGAINYPGCGLAVPYRYGAYFSKKGFSGVATLLTAGGSPATINTPGDEVFGQKPREATLAMIATDVFHLAGFFSNNDRDIFLTIERVTTVTQPQPLPDGNVYAGWVSPFEAKEPYASAPYPMEVSIVDGLGSLADYPFYQYPSGVPYTGTITLIDALITALAWTGFYLPLYSSFHLAEESFWGTSSLGTPQHPGPHHDFFANVKASVSRWKKDDGTWQSCKQVIDDIIGPNARLLQLDGAWRILRLTELPGVSNARGDYGFIRTWVVYTTSSTGSTVISYVEEDPRVTVYKQNEVVPLQGANLAIRRNEPRVKITLNYGSAPDVLTNGGMLGNPGTIPDGWVQTHVVGPDAGPHTSGITDAGNGVLVAATDTLPSRARILGLKNGDPKRALQTEYRSIYILEEPFYFDLKPGQVLKLVVSGSYINNLTGGAAIEVVATVGYYNPGTTSFQPMPNVGPTADVVGTAFNLQSDGSWSSKKKSSTINYLHFLNLLPDPPQTPNTNDHGKNYQIPKATNGEQFSISTQAIPNLPFPGAFIPGQGSNPFPTVVRVVINLWPGPDYDSRLPHTGCYTDYFNIRLTQDETAVVDLDREELYAEIAGLTVRDRKRTTEINTNLGYQTTAHMLPKRALRPGGLLKLDGITPIGRVMNTTGHIDKLQNIDARERLEMFGRQRSMYDGPKLTDANPLSVLYLPELGGLYMIPINHKWKLRERIVDGRDTELPTTIDRLTDPILSGNYLTKDGAVYPMKDAVAAGPGTVNTPTSPGGTAEPVIASIYQPISPRFGTPDDVQPIPAILYPVISPQFLRQV